MNLTEGFLRDNLFIDFGGEILYGSNQMFVTYPLRFATVNFPLMSTAGLSQIADRIRKEAGFVPLSPMDEYTDETCDSDAWYDFNISVNDFLHRRTDAGITVTVANTSSPDNEETYTIDLDEHEQECVYSRLDKQCRKYLGKGCEELLSEVRARMEEDMS